MTEFSSHKDSVAPSEPLAKRAYRDHEADWTVKNDEPVHGYKVYAAQDHATGLVTVYLVTTASVHDSNVFEQLLSGDEVMVLADKAYGSEKRRRE